VESGVSILIDLIDITKGADEDAGDSGMTVSAGCMERCITVIILQIRFASGHEEDAGCAIMTILAGEVQSRKAALVFDVGICFVLHQHLSRFTESLPCRFMQWCIALKFVLGIDVGTTFEQQLHQLHMSLTGCQVQRRESRLRRENRGNRHEQEEDQQV
jgi:hypothetical protein